MVACDSDSPLTPEYPQPLNFEFSFQNSDDNFITGFADYPEGSEEQYQLTGGWSDLPEHDSLDTDDRGIMLHGANGSDDLFMFVKRRLGSTDGVEAEVVYRLDMSIKLASENGSGCAGAGGAPGESNFFKAGASNTEPEAIASDGFMQMTIDKGQQSNGGADALTVGDLANGTDSCSADVWRYKNLHLDEFYVKSSATGDIWLLLGTDSGYEGITTYYFSEISVDLTPTEMADVPGI
jgi:hypothetical protein